MKDRLAKFSTIQLGRGSAPVFGNDDPLGVSSFFNTVYGKKNVFRQGLVIAYHPQAHSAAVLMQEDSSIWSCVFADELLSYSFGFSETHPAREGEFVLVLEVAAFANAGIIIGRIPYHLNFSGNGGDKYNDPDQYHRRSYTWDEENKSTWDRNIPCFVTPMENKDDDSTHVSTHFRPTDVYPGEFAHVNQHNCGIKGGLFSATLLGGGASLRLSALSNLARLTCESYHRISMTGNIREFHNGRYLSSEREIALFQEERLGGTAPYDNVWTEDSKGPSEGKDQTIRPRIKELSGYFGNLSAKFCLRPDLSDTGSMRVLGTTPNEGGVSRETIDPSGQYRFSSSGMIAIERTGRIPVPVRTCRPEDKDHDIESNPETLKPFEHDDSDPCYRQLELFDRQAYDLKNQYSRVDGLGDEYNADYYTPQEDEMNPLEDQYDPKFTKSETVKLAKYDKRRAGTYIGEDGSIIIRDAWGSEIVMLGGNVSISCAGNVMLLPGKTALTIAGDDIVQKAQNSVDIHASEHDVRLSAARNMEILGGGDESQYSGGVIIESRGKGVSPWDGKDKGEQARVSGITLRTKSQGVVIDGQKVVVRSRKVTKIVSGDKSIDGRVDIGAKTFRARTKTAYIASEGAAMAVNRNSFSAIARSIGIYASSGLTLTKGAKTPIPMKWEDIGNIAEEYLPKFIEATKDLADEKQASEGFSADALEKMVFGFRTSQECGTDKPWSIGGSGDKFRMYEPAWIQVMKIYETLKNGGVDSKAYEEKPEWDNGKPFPGKEADDSAEYAQLAGLQPKNLTSDGFNASRKTVKERSQISPVKLKGGYLVRK